MLAILSFRRHISFLFPPLSLSLLFVCNGCFENQEAPDFPNESEFQEKANFNLISPTFGAIVDSANLKISGPDMQKIQDKKCFVDKTPQQEIFASDFISNTPNFTTFELSVYQENKVLSYYGAVVKAKGFFQLGIIPHKVTSSLQVSDILNPVPANQKFTWMWTGTSGGGSQNSSHYTSDTLVLDSVTHARFIAQDSLFANGSYVFRFKSKGFDFGWRIPDSAQGKSLQLSYSPKDSGQIKLSRGSWVNQTVDFSDSLEYTFEPALWHVVQILDTAGTLGIYFDGIQLDFFTTHGATQYLSDLGSGRIGIGTVSSGLKVSDMMGLR